MLIVFSNLLTSDWILVCIDTESSFYNAKGTAKEITEIGLFYILIDEQLRAWLRTLTSFVGLELGLKQRGAVAVHYRITENLSLSFKRGNREVPEEYRKAEMYRKDLGTTKVIGHDDCEHEMGKLLRGLEKVAPVVFCGHDISNERKAFRDNGYQAFIRMSNISPSQLDNVQSPDIIDT
jgi:hypothetical protein